DLQTEEILTKQRTIHESLIGRGLVIISDSYLDTVERRCAEAGVPFSRQACEGRNYEELIRAARSGNHDLVALGAYGLGKSKRTLVGSVCERVVRGVEVDALVVRQAEPLGGAKIVVAVDGSDCSFAAVNRALQLAKTFGASVTALAVYDPFFHRVAFESIAGVLSAEAAKLFRFREQEVLHDEIIDSGLMKLYQLHLDRAAEMAESAGLALETKVLEGKPYDALLDYVEEHSPTLLVMGRFGFHQGEAALLGSNVENALRLVPCNVLVVTPRPGDAEALPEAKTATAEEGLTWTPEALKGLERVPFFVRNMARQAIEKYARREGLSVVTPGVVNKARGRFGK
ncbi:MAG: universal stress protein, partial [Dehalococcoidales bacterium]|nr:universal stress protein [Dehalococcoidales bacterium]